MIKIQHTHVESYPQFNIALSLEYGQPFSYGVHAKQARKIIYKINTNTNERLEC
jgi:hypothetical protein